MALHKRLARKFDEEIRFFRGWIDGPKRVGAIIPTSMVTARRMASVVDPVSARPVLELGPGTGVITRAILERGVAPDSIVSIEYSKDFYDRLVKDLPGVRFIRGDAFRLNDTLGPFKDTVFDCVISAVPMLSWPVEQRIALMEDLLDRLPPGRPVVQISYSALPPVPAVRGRYRREPLDWMMRNVPPARLWTYRR